MMELLASPEAWVSLLSLTAMEIVLGIDNIVFLALLVGKLAPADQPRARFVGLVLALVMRLGLLFTLTWIMRLSEPFFHVLGHGFSGRDLVLLAGGGFLVAKATIEIHEKLEGAEAKRAPAAPARMRWVLVQIVLLDAVFSLDSVITAVGMAQQIPIMIAAMLIAVGVMLVFAGAIGRFIERHPSLKLLALAFLLLIGVFLVADGMGQHIGKGYIYSAMAFSLGVELLNMRLRRVHEPVTLHHPFEEGNVPGGKVPVARETSG